MSVNTGLRSPLWTARQSQLAHPVLSVPEGTRRAAGRRAIPEPLQIFYFVFGFSFHF